jgi:hypothetical protein
VRYLFNVDALSIAAAVLEATVSKEERRQSAVEAY